MNQVITPKILRVLQLALICSLFLLSVPPIASGEQIVDKNSPEWQEIYKPPVKEPTEVKKGSKLRKELFDKLRPKISKMVAGKKLMFSGSLKTYRNWAFFSGRTVDEKGASMQLGELKNSDTVALWLRTRDGWQLVDFSGGHSDVFYVVWPEQYGAPRSLLGFK